MPARVSELHNSGQLVRQQRHRAALSRYLIADLFALAYCLVLGLTFENGPAAENLGSILGLGIVLGGLCLLTFFSAGSRRILFSSMISYGHLVFVASPAVMIGLGQVELRSDLRSSVAVLFLSFFFVIQLALFGCSRPLPKGGRGVGEVSGSVHVIAWLFFVPSIIASYLAQGSLIASFLAPMSLVGIVLVTLVVATRPSLKQSIFPLMSLALMMLIYATYQFDGFGRIVVASYLLAIAIVLSWTRESFLPKLIVAIVTIPGILLLSTIRIVLVERDEGRRINLDESLGSVFAPFQIGAFLLQSNMDGTIAPTMGRSIFTSALFWVPRSFWEAKPEGFGRAIVPFTNPQLVASQGHSDAAPYLAEFVWDFGVWGIVPTLVLLFAILKMDRFLGYALSSQEGVRHLPHSVPLITIWTVLLAMTLNLVWGGTFPYVSRTMTAIVVLMIFNRLWSGRARISRGDMDKEHSYAALTVLKPKDEFPSVTHRNYLNSGMG